VADRMCNDLAHLHRRGHVHGRIATGSIRWQAGSSSLPLRAAHGAAADAVYQAPEQTGRINRHVDYRVDFYALGVVWYELLTGAPPFAFEDPLELAHAHIARMPASPEMRRPDLPEPLPALVLRLLAKEPEDRYQSAEGLRHDLDRCRSVWINGAAPFELGEHDVSDRFVIPQRLYGRERQVATLRRAFETTCGGPTQLLLVAGYSGVGKTSLIRELHRPVVRQRGYFIAGKFDQVVRSVPYGAMIQAFRGMVAQLLTESPERVDGWRDRLSQALGANGGVLAGVLPDIELILGPQAPPPPLDPAEAQNRFRYVLQNFVRTLARPEHPLVIALDDLQWVDAATLDLLQAILTDEAISHLLVIGAFRDNEVGEDHPLTRAIGGIVASGGLAQRLALGSLALDHLVPFLCDTLRDEARSVEPLAHLIQQKTDGNPFFVIQFLRSLCDEGFFEFDRTRRRWTYRLEDIARAQTTDNVVVLMTRKIQWLTASAQDAVTLAACLGNRVDHDTLIAASARPAAELTAGMREACEAGLLDMQPGPDDGSPAVYTFLHDQVQRAAYDLIPDALKPTMHRDVGRLLLSAYRERPSDDRLFEVVNQLNIGRQLIDDPRERVETAALNLAAGRRAMASAAYQAACDYLDAGLSVVHSGHWDSDYELVFALHLMVAECRYLVGAFDRAERELGGLLPSAATARDRALVHALRITLYENQSRWTDALSSGRDGLALFGIELPEERMATEGALEREVAATQEALGGRSIASLIDLPVMSDPDVQMVMRMLTNLWAPAYISGNQLLARLLSATMVRLSLQHGNTGDSAYGYVTHAITIGPIRGDYEAAYEWGVLALAVNDRLGDAKRRAKIHQQFQAHVNLWRRPLESCLPHAQEACRSGLETGDFIYAGYGAGSEAWAAWLINRDLETFVREYTPHLDLLARLKMWDFREAHRVMLNWARALQGRTADRTSLAGEGLDEQAFVDKYETSAPFFLTFFYAAKLHLHLLYHEDAAALTAARKARAATPEGIVWPVMLDTWAALAMAALCRTAMEADRLAYLRDIRATRVVLANLAEQCPENFRVWFLLVAASERHVEGDPKGAVRHYQEAITLARAAGQIAQEALAQEACAHTWLATGETSLAAPCLREAHRAYGQWGAARRSSSSNGTTVRCSNRADPMRLRWTRARPTARRSIPRRSSRSRTPSPARSNSTACCDASSNWRSRTPARNAARSCNTTTARSSCRRRPNLTWAGSWCGRARRSMK
jgi:predicted ATPase